MNEPSVKRIRIGLNALYLRPGRIGGGETYARELIEGCKSLNLSYEFIIFLNSEAFPTFAELDSHANFKRVLCRVPLNAPLRHAWEQIYFPSLCRKYRLDLLHSLGGVTPFWLPCANTVTIHDLLYKVEPASLPWMRRAVLGRLVTASARRCDLVITVSLTSQENIIRYLAISADKIRVTLEGPGQAFQTALPWEQVQRKYNVPQPYFLTVGTATHKRVDGVVQAAEILRAEKKFTAAIVTTSPIGHLPPSTSTVKHLGYVPPEDLASLYDTRSRSSAFLTWKVLD
jgi:hypothetical protein